MSSEHEALSTPAAWVHTTIAALGRLHCGQSPPSAQVNRDGEGTPYVSGPEQWDGYSVHMNKWTTASGRSVPAGTVFITVKGSGVGTLFPGVACAIGRDIYAFEPHAPINFRFVYRALQFSISHVISKARGDIPGLSKAHILEHPIAIPGPGTQERVASKIDELFSRIDEGERALEQVSKFVERYRQSVLKAAVTGELTRDWREARKVAGEPVESGEALLTRILTARREAWEQAELAKMKAKGIKREGDAWKTKYKAPPSADIGDLPELPDNWVWASFEQVFAVASDEGKKLKESEYLARGAFAVIDQGAQFISGRTDREDLLFAGSLPVIGFGDHTRRFKLIDMPFVVGADGLKLFNAFEGLTYKFAMTVLRAAKFEDRGYSRHFQFLRKVAIPVPPVAEQARIAELLDCLDSQVEDLVKQLNTEGIRASALRRSVLKNAFAGKLIAPQSSDEPASVVLGRIAAESASTHNAAPKRGRK